MRPSSRTLEGTHPAPTQSEQLVGHEQTAKLAEGSQSSLSFFGSLSQNPYFSAGTGLLLIGGAMAGLRFASRYAVTFARQRLVTSMELTGRDPSFHWFMRWMAKNGPTPNHLYCETTFAELPSGKMTAAFRFSPGTGRHFFKFKNRVVLVERNRQRSNEGAASIIDTPFETVTMSTLKLFEEKNIFVDILEEARAMILQEQEGKTVVYTGWGQEWKSFGEPRTRRPLRTVLLQEGQLERIRDDVKNFINNEKWYKERGIPYRRGYLLYGSPGSGKTSFIMALAGELEYDICILNLNDESLTDDRLAFLLSVAPRQTFIILEDIDAMFVQREKSHYSRVTFSGLLNALDGILSTERRILFMTTNHVERLDPALIRPGRVDMKEKFDFADSYQIKNMFTRFYPERADIASEFAVRALQSANHLSMAQVQGYLMRYLNNPEAALKNVGTIIE
jgi:chaperone BCS1